ncbi:hypothetical protein D3C86_1777870 [compost metagenome]
MVQRFEQGEAVGTRSAEAEGEDIDRTGLGRERIAHDAVNQRHPARRQRWQATGVTRQGITQRRVGAGLEDAGHAAIGGSRRTRHIADPTGNAISQAILVDGTGRSFSGRGWRVVIDGDHQFFGRSRYGVAVLVGGRQQRA